MKTFVTAFLALLTLTTFAQSEQTLLTAATRYETALNEDAAYETYRQVLKVNPNHYYALWKASELCSRVGNRQPTKEKKQEFFETGKRYAEKAIKVNPNGADGYFALSVAMGRLALTNSGSDKIKAVKEIKLNAEKAIKLNPNHGYAWHVLGKWYFEVSQLNYLEKTAVRVFFGALPPATLADAIRAYERSRQLVPDLTLNYYELAKAYKEAGQKAKAIEYLKKLPSLPNKTQDDPKVKAKGAQLLKELTS